MKTILIFFLITIKFSFAQKNLDSLFRAKDNKAKGLSKNDFTDNDKRNGGWSLIADNPAMYSYAGTSASGGVTGKTYKSLHYALANCYEIKLVYGNFIPIFTSINPNWNQITVGASIVKNSSENASKVATFSSGNIKKIVDRFSLAVSDPIFIKMTSGDKFYVNSYVNALLPSAPSAPTLTEILTGGTMTGAASYNISITYVFASGLESLASTATQITLTAGANTRQVTVTSPSSVAGSIGYRCYMSAANDNSNTVLCRVSDTTPFSTNTSILTSIPSNCSEYVKPNLTIIPSGNGLNGSTLYDGLNTGEGIAVGDATVQNSYASITQNSNGNVYYPIAILGKTNTHTKTVALIGDSIMAGTGDNGYRYSSGGFATRALCNQTAYCFSTSTIPLYPHVRVPLGGETLAQFIDQTSSNRYDNSRRMVTTYATNVISNYGTNDLSGGLTAMKANLLVLADWYISRGIKFYQCTLFPKTTSTDGWITTANQTVTAQESIRTGFNDWLRDNSVTGFKSQAGGLLVDVIDITQYIEVNSANTITTNGGLWKIDPTGVVTTGSITTRNSGAEFIDSSKSLTANVYKGFDIRMTSGTEENKCASIGWNNTNTFNLYGTIGAGNTAVGNTYEIRHVPTIDGTHPSSWGSIQVIPAVTIKFSTFQ